MFVSAALIASVVLATTQSFAAASGKWEFYAYEGLNGMMSYGRLDPIIAPGTVSQHVHQISGANAMQATYDYNTLRSESTCTNILVQDDLSNYWTPAMYHYDGANNYSLMISGFHVYYQFTTFSYDANNAAGSNTRVAFPAGLTMLAGNMYQRSVNSSDPFSTAAIFQCLRSSGNSPYSHDMRDFQKDGLGNCDQSLRTSISFPSCWDGKAQANTTDFSHVVYPNPFTNVCPASHPQAMMHIVQEYYYMVQDFPFDPTRTDNWVLSFGDTSGFGLHADFANGWNVTLLQQAINDPTCNSAEAGIEKCEAFSRWNGSTIPPCMPSGMYPNEPVGLDNRPLTALPGCNALWTDNSTKPTCTNQVTPSLDLQLGPDLTEWNFVSCAMSATNIGDPLTALEVKNITSVDSCLSICSNAGYTYAGVTQQPNFDANGVWETMCFCDSQIRNNYPLAPSTPYSCMQRCPGKYMELCGGAGPWQLYERCTGNACHANSAFPSVATAAPVWLAPSSTVKAVASAASSVKASVVSSASSVAKVSTSAAVSSVHSTTTSTSTTSKATSTTSSKATSTTSSKATSTTSPKATSTTSSKATSTTSHASTSTSSFHTTLVTRAVSHSSVSSTTSTSSSMTTSTKTKTKMHKHRHTHTKSA